MLKKFVKTADQRQTKYPNPSLLERLMGLVCFGCILIQIFTKVRTKTLIFLFNPCHLFTIVWGIILNMRVRKTSQILMLFAVSNISAPTIGMVFAENDELQSNLEIISYWVQHVIASFLAPMICLLSGRFAHKIYSNPVYIVVGYQMF